MNAIPVLTIDDVATLDGVLADFLKKAEAELTVVIDRGGNVISQYGDMTVMDVTIIAALAAGSQDAEERVDVAGSSRLGVRLLEQGRIDDAGGAEGGQVEHGWNVAAFENFQ